VDERGREGGEEERGTRYISGVRRTEREEAKQKDATAQRGDEEGRSEVRDGKGGVGECAPRVARTAGRNEAREGSAGGRTRRV